MLMSCSMTYLNEIEQLRPLAAAVHRRRRPEGCDPARTEGV